MKILLDAYGGDNAPLEIIKGAVEYVKQGGLADVCLVGNEEEIRKIMDENKFSYKNIEIKHASQVITCHEAPTEAIRKKPDSSLCVGFSALRSGEYDALVSAGSTGAVLTGAVLKVGRIKGVNRPALCTFLPTIDENKEVMYLDCGANADTKPINLVQFALMADIYARKVKGIENPKIALLSNGTEDEKGCELILKVNPVLRKLEGINFVGNIEARDILTGEYDIVVTEGFAGNVGLKAVEGSVNAVFKIMKSYIKKSFLSTIGAMFMKNTFKKMKTTLDYNSKGGAVFLGANGVMIKSHGSSKAPAIKAGLFMAEQACKANVKDEIAERLQKDDVKSLVFD